MDSAAPSSSAKKHAKRHWKKALVGFYNLLLLKNILHLYPNFLHNLVWFVETKEAKRMPSCFPVKTGGLSVKSRLPTDGCLIPLKETFYYSYTLAGGSGSLRSVGSGRPPAAAGTSKGLSGRDHR